MIRALGRDSSGKLLVVLGLSRSNCERLLNHEPILIEPGTLPGVDIAIAILASETEQTLLAELEPMLPKGIEHAPRTARRGETVVVTNDGFEIVPRKVK